MGSSVKLRLLLGLTIAFNTLDSIVYGNAASSGQKFEGPVSSSQK